jgi:hypothetical protein
MRGLGVRGRLESWVGVGVEAPERTGGVILVRSWIGRGCREGKIEEVRERFLFIILKRLLDAMIG